MPSSCEYPDHRRHSRARDERSNPDAQRLPPSDRALLRAEGLGIRRRDLFVALAERGQHHSRMRASLEIAESRKRERDDE